MRAFSRDLRERVLADCDAGQRNEDVARKYHVSAAWIRRLKQRRRDTGSIEPRVHRVPPPRLCAYTDQIRSLVKQRPDATLRELREALGVPTSLPSLCRALQRLRLTVKKSPPRRRAGSARRGGPTAGMARSNVWASAGTFRFHRRDLGDDEHDAAIRTSPARTALGGRGAAWTLEDDDLHRRFADDGTDGTNGH